MLIAYGVANQIAEIHVTVSGGLVRDWPLTIEAFADGNVFLQRRCGI